MCTASAGRKHTHLAQHIRTTRALTLTHRPNNLKFSLSRIVTFAPNSRPRVKRAAAARSTSRPRTRDTHGPNPAKRATIVVTIRHRKRTHSLSLLALSSYTSINATLNTVRHLPATFLSTTGCPIFAANRVHSRLAT